MVKLYIVQLSDDQRTSLEQIIHKGTAPAQIQNRARALLLADKGQRDVDIAQALFTSTPTVQRTRMRFVTQGLDAALYDKARCGRPPHLTGEVEAHLVTIACSQAPEGRERWTMQLLADQLVALRIVDSISDEAVRKMLKKTNLSLGS